MFSETIPWNNIELFGIIRCNVQNIVILDFLKFHLDKFGNTFLILNYPEWLIVECYNPTDLQFTLFWVSDGYSMYQCCKNLKNIEEKPPQ
jgi:hypothetical protein